MLTSLIIHGGCGSLNPQEPLQKRYWEDKEIALKSIITECWPKLLAGQSALEVVEHAINLLEMNPAFNAGIGATPNSENKIGLDAALMRGDTLSCGAVAKLTRNPKAISVARAVMEKSPHVLLVGEGADRFAEQQGFAAVPEKEFETDFQKYWWARAAANRKDRETLLSTVGAVARDQNGVIVAGTSTGGTTFSLPGRVGDSPLIGAGCYADNNLGGASCTGHGERIIACVLAKTALDLIEYKQLSAMQACQQAVEKLGKLPDGRGALIILDKHGQIGFACNEQMLSRAYMTSAMQAPVVEF